MLSRLRSFLKLDKKLSNKSTLSSLLKLQRGILETLEFDKVIENSVNSVLTELGYLNLGYRIIVLALINEATGTLDRMAISQTIEAKKALELTPIPFKDIRIPISETGNLCIRSVKELAPFTTHDWYDILRPLYTSEQAARIQHLVGIKASMIYPIIAKGLPRGVLIFSLIKNENEVLQPERELIEGLTNIVGIAVENSTLYTSLSKTKQQLEIANQRLKELDQLKDDFVSVASHELRTPMTAIRSYVWMALHKSDVPLSQKLEKYLYRTLLSTERLINLVSDMLNVSRIEAGKIEINPKPFNIVQLVKDVMEEVKVKADEKSLQLLVLEHSLPQVFADPDKAHQVLLNLIGNALKFTYPGGTVTVDFFTDGKTVEVSVKDNGLGIAKDDLSKLFHKFSRLDNSYTAVSTSGGTGLGLYISKSLVELMHGSIRVTSEGTDKGSTFTFSLPIASQETLKHAAQFTVKAKGEVKGLEPVAI